ncbi:Cytosolic copper metallochaperone [Ceratobasidium sp. 414]|nr:Cytosolic copper metallochaperone [Ceratobasidium sp. 414]
MSEHTYKFDVAMSCSGCSGAVTRVLEKAKAEGEPLFPSLFSQTDIHNSLGVSSYEVSLEKQEVVVKGTISYDDVLAKIKKTGKEASTLATATPPY